MNNDDNLYKILNISFDAKSNEIKKAYKLLVLKYHPDKNKDIEAKDKFIKIQSAYETLIDENLRKEYDLMHNQDKSYFQQKIFNYFNNFYEKNFNQFMMLFCDDQKYIYNIINNKYDKAFMYLVNKYIKKENTNNKLDIVDNVECDLIDRYNNNYSYIEVVRKSRNNAKLYVPLRNEINIFYGEGEINNDEVGDLILYTKTINNNGFYCKDGDMFKQIEIKKTENGEIENGEIENGEIENGEIENGEIENGEIENGETENGEIENGEIENGETENGEKYYFHVNGDKIKIDENDIINNKYIIFYGLGLPLSKSGCNRGDLVCEITII
jgi:DnaJ domain